MSAEETPAIQTQDRLRAEDLLYAELFHTGEGKIKWIAFGVAVVLHVAVLFVHFPTFETKIEAKKENVIIVKRYVPPPPKVERRQVKQQKLTRRVPVPDPTPDEPEPIREPEPEIEPEPLPPDVEFLIGTPDTPPPSGPLLPGVEGVTSPVRIESSAIKPVYPEIARVARVEGRVIVQAVILRDGSVADVEILSCNRPNMGFEESAIDAVKQWRYQPAMQGDRPVDVYFTVVVEFDLS
jgi:protein TonB